MIKYNYKAAKFIKSATDPKDYPILKDDSGKILLEVSVAGRSNVGKSSLLNDLFQQKHLVKTSSVPGKTQLINFFSIADQLIFTDLPGYGYAKVPQNIRKNWGKMIQTYLDKRENLELILFLFDIRRKPNEEDLQFLDWVCYHQKAIILVLTKIDKLNQSEVAANTKAILKAFDIDNLQYVHYSVPKSMGREKLTWMIADALQTTTIE